MGKDDLMPYKHGCYSIVVDGSTGQHATAQEKKTADVYFNFRQETGTVTINDVTFVKQNDGSVLWDRADFAQQANGSIKIK